MESIARLIPDVIKFADGQADVVSAACCAAWGLAVGDATLKVSRAITLTDRTLTVAVQDARWKRQLEALAPQILFRLNSILRQPLVTRIHLVVDRRFVARTPSRAASPLPAAMRPELLPEEIVAGAQAIADEDLRTQFLRLAAVCLGRGCG
ncbi:MAG: DUF721 domain-containing protein [Chloracidobacterium sp.]|nr:DUF721 domain-containing protein [Chloracidobacterium sp.]MDW8217192.1 DciA family protein [Acidobacteriota bacterium]